MLLPSGPFTPEQWARLLNIPVDEVRHGTVVSLGLGYGGLLVRFVSRPLVPCDQFRGLNA